MLAPELAVRIYKSNLEPASAEDYIAVLRGMSSDLTAMNQSRAAGVHDVLMLLSAQ